MSKTPPFIRWWIGDYYRKTTHLSPEERYAYSELLWAQFLLGGRLPKDVRELRRLARAEGWSLQKFRKVWDGIQAVGRPAYRPKFREDERGFYNPRAEAELGAATGQAEQLSESGRRGALRRWGCPACRAAGEPMEPGTLDGSEKTCPRCGVPFAELWNSSGEPAEKGRKS